MDLFEFGVDEAVCITEVLKSTDDHHTKGIGSKPMILFIGEQWESDAVYQRIQNLLLGKPTKSSPLGYLSNVHLVSHTSRSPHKKSKDMFRGTKVEKISLKGLDHVLGCSVVDGKIYIRVYTIRFKKSGSKIPLVSLSNMGPFWDLTVRRTQLASEDLWKLSCKQPKMYVTLCAYMFHFHPSIIFYYYFPTGLL